MKTPEDVINRFINEENVKFNQERDDWVIEAMEEYAKLYHENQTCERCGKFPWEHEQTCH